MQKEDIIALIAKQTFYLFDTNHTGLLLPDKEVRLLSNNHSRIRLLLEQIFTEAKNQQLIDEGTTLWDFVEMIRNDFKLVFNHRAELLSKADYSNTFVYPHEEEKFLLKGNFKIVEPKPVTTVTPQIIETVEREEDSYTDVEDIHRRYDPIPRTDS